MLAKWALMPEDKHLLWAKLESLMSWNIFRDDIFYAFKNKVKNVTRKVWIFFTTFEADCAQISINLAKNLFTYSILFVLKQNFEKIASWHPCTAPTWLADE